MVNGVKSNGGQWKGMRSMVERGDRVFIGILGVEVSPSKLRTRGQRSEPTEHLFGKDVTF